MKDGLPRPAESPGEAYARIRARTSFLLGEATPEQAALPVPSCPGWTVHDVAAHLVGNVEDWFEGRLSGPPDEATTATQVHRHQRTDIATLVSIWSSRADAFEAAITAGERWAAVIDALSHEFDIRHALGRPGSRTDPAVGHLAEMLARRVADRVTVVLDDRPPPAEEGQQLRLRTTAFEFFRAAMGRRSLGQMLALDWSADPADVVASLCVFGPALSAIDE